METESLAEVIGPASQAGTVPACRFGSARTPVVVETGLRHGFADSINVEDSA